MKWMKRRANETYKEFDKRVRRATMRAAWIAVGFAALCLMSLSRA